jgi:hypothetical protein
MNSLVSEETSKSSCKSPVMSRNTLTTTASPYSRLSHRITLQHSSNQLAYLLERSKSTVVNRHSV